MLWVRFRLDGVVREATLQRRGGAWRVEVDGIATEAPAPAQAPAAATNPAVADSAALAAAIGHARAIGLEVLDVGRLRNAGGAGGGQARAVKAPMAGRLDRVAVAVGEDVKAGQVLFVLEAMKMQNEVRALSPGKVQAVRAAPGAALDAGTVVLELA